MLDINHINHELNFPSYLSARNLQQKKTPATQLIIDIKRKLVGSKKFFPPTLLLVVRTIPLVPCQFTLL